MNLKQLNLNKILTYILTVALFIQAAYLLFLPCSVSNSVSAQMNPPPSGFDPAHPQNSFPSVGRFTYRDGETPTTPTGGVSAGQSRQLPPSRYATSPGQAGDAATPTPVYTMYPHSPGKRNMRPEIYQYIHSRYLLHKWVLSDLIWGLFELQNSKYYQLTPEQVKKIYPAVKRLAEAVMFVEKSNQKLESLLTAEQKSLIKRRLKDQAYMYSLTSRFPSTGKDEPMLGLGVNRSIYEASYRIISERAARADKK